MTMTMKKTMQQRGTGVSRRGFLRGSGQVAIALPWLEIMSQPKRARAATPTIPAKRFLAVYQPGGTVLENWRPTGTESNFTLSPILAPLEPVKNRLIVLDGVHMKCADQTMFNVEQCQGGMVGWLTGMVQPGAGRWVTGPSIDQVLARRLSAGKQIASLQMAIRWGTGKSHGLLHPINTGTFADSASFSPIPPQLDPVKIWQMLFGDARAPTKAAWDRSILDAVRRRYVRLSMRLGTADRQRLQDHMEKIREIEKQVAVQAVCKPPVLVDTSDYNPASGLNSADDGNIRDLSTDAAIPKVGKLMTDMMVMAFACDLTAVGLLQWSDTEAKHTFPWLGLPEHHRYYQNDGGYRPVELTQIATWYSSQHAYLLQELAKVDLGGHKLIDETVVFFGSERQHAANYSKRDMPFLLAGGGGLRTGRWVRHTDAPPHNNLLVSLFNLFGDARTTFGDPRCVTGSLPNLV